MAWLPSKPPPSPPPQMSQLHSGTYSVYVMEVGTVHLVFTRQILSLQRQINAIRIARRWYLWMNWPDILLTPDFSPNF